MKHQCYLCGLPTDFDEGYLICDWPDGLFVCQLCRALIKLRRMTRIDVDRLRDHRIAKANPIK